MATTTNFGWSTPDDTGLVKDGALNIRTLGSAIDTTLGAFFNIKQIVTGFTTTQIGSSSSTYADTGLTATITPSSTSNKILVFVAQNGLKKINNTSMNLRLLRGATTISNFGIQVGYTNTALELNTGSASTMIFDAPATTSSVTYKTQFSSQANIGFVDAQFASASSQIVLLEVEA
jgi:hypothetical protein